MDCKKLNMRPEEVALVNSVKSNRYNISPMQFSNVAAPLSSIAEMPIKLNFAEPHCVNLMSPSQFEVSEQFGDQPSFLPQDFQLGYMSRECGQKKFQKEVSKWDTCISNILLKQQQQPVLEQQHLEESTCVKQEACYYQGLVKGNRHDKLLENISPAESTYGHCSCSCNKIQCKDSQWHLMHESMLNDYESSARCLTPEDLLSAPIMPMLPFDPHVSPTSTGLSYSKRANSHEDIMNSHGHEMMMNSLPEKGKLLEAVLKAGPLLQTLLLAGPLPMWQRPPPDLDSSQIPLVPIVPTPSPPIIPPLNPTPAHENFSCSPIGFTHKSPQEVNACQKDQSFILAQSYPYPYSPLPLTPTSSSFKKRFMSMDESLHNARSPLKHAKLQ